MNEQYSKTFQLSDNVHVEKVRFSNRYGIIIVADMYYARGLDFSKRYPALVIGTPYGGVKEQGAGIYAQEMAQRGFIAMAFDESFNGESGGVVRHLSSPEIFVEDFSAGVDFLGTRAFVNREQIGVIGICGSGAFAITAAQVDTRIKAVATVSMYDMARVKRNGWMDSYTEEQRFMELDRISRQRWTDFRYGQYKLTPAFPDEPVAGLPEGLDPITSEFFGYYATKRGFASNSIAAFTETSDLSFMNFPLANYIDTISPRPLLFIMGEHAHSRYFTEDLYARALEPKQLYIVPSAGHVDLYDKTDLIPLDLLDRFFKDHLLKK